MRSKSITWILTVFLWGLVLSCSGGVEVTIPGCETCADRCVQEKHANKGRCVACLRNPQCQSDSSPTKKCTQDNKCVCGSDRDCSSGQYCKGESGCVSCLKNEHCKEVDLPVCSDNKCMQCSLGASQDCLPQGDKACVKGTQQCQGGVWGECKDWKACSDAEKCVDNKCVLDCSVNQCKEGALECTTKASEIPGQYKVCTKNIQGCYEFSSGIKDCPPRHYCDAGKCVQATCPKEQTDCSNQCVNLKNDRDHCGRCGMRCKSGEVCEDGRCLANCSSGQTDCSGACADLQTDRNHCGRCGEKCKYSCLAGRCELTCSAGQSKCADTCVDLQSNKSHCGACSNACTSGQVCINGRCLSCTKDEDCGANRACNNGSCTGCRSGYKDCNGVCINSGGCCVDNDCSGNKACYNGSCVGCRSGYKDCNATCILSGSCCFDTDCPPGHLCQSQQCQLSCPSLQTKCGNACVDLQQDPGHCGSCNHPCSTSLSEKCVQGKCEVQCPQTCVLGASRCVQGGYTEECGLSNGCPKWIAPKWCPCGCSNGQCETSQSGCTITIAGTGHLGYKDGPADQAQFNRPMGCVSDSGGNIFIADSKNHRIRKLDLQGNVTTFAGNGVAGFADGSGSTASFKDPSGLAIDGAGNLYVADRENHRIRKIDRQGNVTTIAGSGIQGDADGPALSAKLNAPLAVAINAAGTVYIADTFNNRIRRIYQGNVEIVVGSGKFGTVDGWTTSAQLASPKALAIEPNGTNMYVAEANGIIRKLESLGKISTITGSSPAGFLDGSAAQAKFSSTIQGLLVDAQGILLIADSYNDRLRKLQGGQVSTFVGGNPNSQLDGIGTSAGLDRPSGIAVLPSGALIVCDWGSHKIRKITR